MQSRQDIATEQRWHRKLYKMLMRCCWQGKNTDACNLEGNSACEVRFTFVYRSGMNDRNQSTILNLTSKVWIPPVLLWQNRGGAEWVYVLTTVLHKMLCAIPDRYWVVHQYITTVWMSWRTYRALLLPRSAAEDTHGWDQHCYHSYQMSWTLLCPAELWAFLAWV